MREMFPYSDADVLEAMIEWNAVPIHQLYTELDDLIKAHQTAQRRWGQPQGIPNMKEWVAFYDDLIKHKR